MDYPCPAQVASLRTAQREAYGNAQHQTLRRPRHTRAYAGLQHIVLPRQVQRILPHPPADTLARHEVNAAWSHLEVRYIFIRFDWLLLPGKDDVLHPPGNPTTLRCHRYASSQPRHEHNLTATDLQEFTTSLELSSGDEDRVLDILAELGIDVSMEDEGRRKRTLPSRVLADCWVLRVVMGESVLFEEEDIQKAVSEGWCVSY